MPNPADLSRRSGLCSGTLYAPVLLEIRDWSGTMSCVHTLTAVLPCSDLDSREALHAKPGFTHQGRANMQEALVASFCTLAPIKQARAPYKGSSHKISRTFASYRLAAVASPIGQQQKHKACYTRAAARATIRSPSPGGLPLRGDTTKLARYAPKERCGSLPRTISCFSVQSPARRCPRVVAFRRLNAVVVQG